MSDWVDVASVGEFAPGTWRVVDIDGAMIAVFNLDGEYYAIDAVCTHEYEMLTEGEVEGDEIVCPRHSARFNIKTGEALTPPAYEPVATFPVRVENGRVQVRDDRWD
ncbi:MAG: non-heme iron oxygenase ferredoxin subunit [Gammaproteobacteria bacterium]